jgi:hypothetical protein
LINFPPSHLRAYEIIMPIEERSHHKADNSLGARLLGGIFCRVEVGSGGNPEGAAQVGVDLIKTKVNAVD